jgi:phosphoribosylformylglycinamidine synthase
MMLRVKNNGKVVAEIPAASLALGSGAPVYIRERSKPKYLEEKTKLNLSEIKIPTDFNEVLLKLLGSPNIASKRWVYEQYDTMVRTGTVVGPGSDACVIRLRKTNKAIAATTDCNGRYCYLNPRMGGRIAVAEAARNLVCSGAKPLAITNCLNFGNPYDPEVYWTFAECVAGMSEACRVFDTPVTGGNVSFYNEDPQRIVYPTPVVGMVGLIENLKQVTTQWFKEEGDVVVLLGETQEELGASEYLKVIHNLVKGNTPNLNLDEEKRIQDACLEMIQKGLIKSAHDCSEGGLAVALAECCISSPHLIGANIKLDSEIRSDALLFGESQSRIVITTKEKDLNALKEIASQHKISLSEIGRVGGEKLKISLGSDESEIPPKAGKVLIDLPVAKLADLYDHSIERIMEEKAD